MFQHALHFSGHTAQRGIGPVDGSHFRQNMGPLGHVFRIVTHTFKAGGDFQNGQDGPQVFGHRRTQRNGAGRLFVDADFQIVDRFVGLAYFVGQLDIAGFKRFGAVQDGLFDHAAHFDDKRLNSF